MNLKFIIYGAFGIISLNSYAQRSSHEIKDFPMKSEVNGKYEWQYQGKIIPEAKALLITDSLINAAKSWVCNLPFKIESVQLSSGIASVTISFNDFCSKK